jgi:hypothetical protein
LKKALYGLKQAPRAWHKRLSKDLGEMGFKPCRSDPALFMDSMKGDARAFIVTYVDDLLIICKSGDRVNEIKDELKVRFKVHDLGEVNNFLGSEVKRDRDGGMIAVSNGQKIKVLADSFGISESDRGYSTHQCAKALFRQSNHKGRWGKRMWALDLHYRRVTGTWSLSDRCNIWPILHGQIIHMLSVCLHVIVLHQHLHTCVQG